jgi:polygalacturonase
MTPLVINAFYFCDPDGKTPYVQSRELYPADERTPVIKRLTFENMNCTNVHVAAAYFDGLPEQKIEEVVMKNLRFSYAEHPKCDVPAMSEGVEPCSLKGIFARNIDRLQMEKVDIVGQVGEAVVLEGVNRVC